MLLITLLIVAGCSSLEPLTHEMLSDAEQKWKVNRPASYRVVIEMSGDRVDEGRFEATIRDEKVTSLRRNGIGVTAASVQDYSMEGLFQMLRQELGLSERPAMLGAPAGYSVYMQAQFDPTTGRLIRYNRSVGGSSNSIEVNVVEFSEL
jgi:hypothetical protein